jgi:hypothetical protein
MCRTACAQLGAVSGLEVRQQVEVAAVVHPMWMRQSGTTQSARSQPPSERGTRCAGSTGRPPQTRQRWPATLARCASDARRSESAATPSSAGGGPCGGAARAVGVACVGRAATYSARRAPRSSIREPATVGAAPRSRPWSIRARPAQHRGSDGSRHAGRLGHRSSLRGVHAGEQDRRLVEVEPVHLGLRVRARQDDRRPASPPHAKPSGLPD